MTTQIVIDIANRINQIDPAMNARAEGGYVKGCYRGVKSKEYKYSVVERAIVYNEGPYQAEKVIAQAMNEVHPA